SKSAQPHFSHTCPGVAKSAAGRAYQASEPSTANTSSTRLSTAEVSETSAHLTQRKAGIGTPQARWRDRHQSGRVSIMFLIRSRDHLGIHCTFSISASARRRSARWSTFKNHCSVARKINGFLQRQQC